MAIRPYSFSHTVYLIDTNRHNSKPPGDGQGAFASTITLLPKVGGYTMTNCSKLMLMAVINLYRFRDTTLYCIYIKIWYNI